MKPTLKQHLLHSVSELNILPLTSVCNVKCIFCSNPQNPPNLETIQMPPLEMTDFRQLLEFIDPARKVVIGESVTRINEGEPLTHPHFSLIIAELRSRFPDIPIQVTTNGILLTEKTVEVLARAGKVELNISLNSCCPTSRRTLMGTPDGMDIKSKVNRVAGAGIPFHGSIVASPHVVGWEDLRESIYFLEKAGAISTRVFLSGHTKWSNDPVKFEESMWPKVHNFISELRKHLCMPVSCEPPLITDLRAEVEGVFPGSPAEKAGIKLGDIILSVDGELVFSRVDAFRKIRSGESCKVSLIRNGDVIALKMDKEPGESPGILMSFDVDPVVLEQIVSRARNRGYRRVLILTSELGEPVMRIWREKVKGDIQFDITKVSNEFFGGTIKAAGLLVIADFIAALQGQNLEGRYDAVFIPGTPFDPWGRDLCGIHFMSLADPLPVPLEIL